MPHSRTTELPDSVKDHLPKHAQEIYKDAYNSAWDEYDHEEQRSHKVAWAAVKKAGYEKGNDGDWHKSKD